MDYTLVNGELFHYGIKGQRWGIRRWQNEDGSLTPDGRKRYSGTYGPTDRGARHLQRDLNKFDKQQAYVIGDYEAYKQKANKYANKALNKMGKYGQEDKRAQKVSQKATKYLKKMLDSHSHLEEMEKKTWQMMANAHTLGYDVSSTKIARDAHKGMTYFDELMRYGNLNGVVIGNQFKVRRGTGRLSIGQ